MNTFPFEVSVRLKSEDLIFACEIFPEFRHFPRRQILEKAEYFNNLSSIYTEVFHLVRMYEQTAQVLPIPKFDHL
jgi:hypothetical protein